MIPLPEHLDPALAYPLSLLAIGFLAGWSAARRATRYMLGGRA